MTTELAVCRHRWKIESPNGEERLQMVRGRCKVCGTEREFKTAHTERSYRVQPKPNGAVSN